MGLNANLYQLSAATCCLSIALGSAPLSAAEPAEGYIVSLDKKELIINLGRENGLLPKRSIELYRRLVVTHPYSNKPIVDRFPIGSVTPSRSVKAQHRDTMESPDSSAPARRHRCVSTAATHQTGHPQTAAGGE